MNRTCLIAACAFGLTAVILGAFGAHALKAQLDADALKSFETGVRYQMWHALLLLMISVVSEKMKAVKWVPWLFIVGIVLFSGSIYVLSCRPVLGLEDVSWLGPVTPLGGLLIIVGWGVLLAGAMRSSGG